MQPPQASSQVPAGHLRRIVSQLVSIMADQCHESMRHCIKLRGCCMQLDIIGSNIHAPLVERLIELPMDISGGRLDGDFHLRSHDPATWHFPAIDGRIRHVKSCRPELS